MFPKQCSIDGLYAGQGLGCGHTSVQAAVGQRQVLAVLMRLCDSPQESVAIGTPQVNWVTEPLEGD